MTVDRICSIVLEIKDITEPDKSASYPELHLEIDTEAQLRTKHNHKSDDFNVPIWNFLLTTLCCNCICSIYISVDTEPNVASIRIDAITSNILRPQSWLGYQLLVGTGMKYDGVKSINGIPTIPF